MRKRIRASFWANFDKKTKKKEAKRTFSEDLRKTIVARRRRPTKTPSDIQIWLAFLDEVIGFWFLTWALYRERIENSKKPIPNRLVCLMTLAGRVFQDMICIRELTESGFFVQSNVVARSLIEAIDVMHLLNMQPELADEFRLVETNGEASKFWHTHCSRNRIHGQIRQRWHWFFKNQSGEMADSAHEQRDRYLDLLGMSVHPSFAASFITFMDSPKGIKVDRIAYNAFGRISQMSKFTIHLIAIRAFEYGMLWVGPEANLYMDNQNDKRKSRLEKLLSSTLSMVFSIISTVDQSKGPNELFPEFKTYWPAKAFNLKE
jgi:hypothetical protein